MAESTTLNPTDATPAPSATIPRRAATPVDHVLWLGFPGCDYVLEDLPNLLSWVDGIKPTDANRPGVVIVIREAAGRTAASVAHVLRGLAFQCDFATLSIALPITASEIVRQTVSPAEQYLESGLVPILVSWAIETVQTAATLDSVAKLSGPGVGDHMASWLPGSCFVSVPGKGIVSGKRRALAVWQETLAGVPRGPLPSIAYTQDAPRDFVAAFPPTANVLPPDAVGPADHWGARRWAEVSWLPVDPAALVARVQATRFVPCPNCRRPSITPICRYCAGPVPVRPAGKP